MPLWLRLTVAWTVWSFKFRSPALVPIGNCTSHKKTTCITPPPSFILGYQWGEVGILSHRPPRPNSLPVLPPAGSLISQKMDPLSPCSLSPSFTSLWGVLRHTSLFWLVFYLKRMILEQLQTPKTFPEIAGKQDHNSRTVIPCLGWWLADFPKDTTPNLPKFSLKIFFN